MNDEKQATCGNCRFWKPIEQDSRYEEPDGEFFGIGLVGDCRFNPPTIERIVLLKQHGKDAYAENGEGYNRLYGSVHPVTFEDDWCGRHFPLAD